MRIFVASLLLTIAVALSSASDDMPECPCNSEMRDVSREPCEPTCTDPESMRCDRSHLLKNTCPSGIRECRCMTGLVRNEDTNQCCRLSECPRPTTMIIMTTMPHEITTERVMCGENEEHAPCGRSCEGTCLHPDMPECHHELCVEHSCRCKSGHVRDEKTDKCVPREKCERHECSKLGEIMALCGRACEGTCDNPLEPKMCLKNVCTKKECRCNLDAGMVRNKMTDECVPMDLCPRIGGVTMPMSGKRRGWRA